MSDWPRGDPDARWRDDVWDDVWENPPEERTVELPPEEQTVVIGRPLIGRPRFTGGRRIAGFNVWVDTQRALGGIGDFIDQHRWKLILALPADNGVGVAIAYSTLYVFLGPRHLAVNRLPDE